MARAFNVMKDGDKERALDIHDYLVKHPDSTFFLKMEGEGPEGSDIEAGDILVVDRSLDPKRGRLTVVAREGELCMENFSKSDEEITVWGVVVGLLRRFE